MRRINSASWHVQSGEIQPRQQLSELVMAWGKDVRTGEARYIFELDESRRGSHCDCVCYCCGQPLTAVNAAKSEWRVRPHFRHPDGADRQSCLVLTARAAALDLLEKQDRIILPARRVSTQVTGLSGRKYTAWVSQAAEAVNIQGFKPLDQVSGLLTLDDGRTVVVKIVGSLSETSDDGIQPVIQLVVDDPALAALDPSTLKAKLHLLVETATWHGPHWADAALLDKAHEQAKAEAANFLDWLPEEAVPELGTDASAETVLHWLTKDILKREGRLFVPALVLKEPFGGTPPKGHFEVARRGERLLQLTDVRLEKKVGHVRPDVVARYLDPEDGAQGTLLVEVTVTNNITAERLGRLRNEGFAALEINVGSLGGVLTRAEFTAIVVDELAAKSWLFHPWLEEVTEARRKQHEDEERNQAEELSSLRERYLSATKRLALLRAEDEQSEDARQLRETEREHIGRLGEELAMYGFEGADDPVLFAWQGCILDRLISIQEDRAIGYRVETLWQVLHAAIIEKAVDKLEWHTLYLSALKAYNPTLELKHQARVVEWREKVRQDLEKCGLEGRTSVYLRSRRFDPLLGFLFPELQKFLTRPLPGEAKPHDAKASRRVRESAEIQPTSAGGNRRSKGYWLTGAELEEWKLKNPESAAAWERGRRN